MCHFCHTIFNAAISSQARLVISGWHSNTCNFTAASIRSFTVCTLTLFASPPKCGCGRNSEKLIELTSEMKIDHYLGIASSEATVVVKVMH